MRIEKIKWSAKAAAALFPVMGSDADCLRDEVERGVSALHRIDADTYMITRVEGDRLIVCAFVGENLKVIAQKIYDAAKKIGCTSIQLHTERPGLQRLLSDFGLVCIGRYYVYEAKVH